MPVNLFFHYPSRNFTPTVVVGRNVKKPIFSNNSLVFIKHIVYLMEASERFVIIDIK